MSPPPRGFTLHSARRRRSRSLVGAVLLVAAIALAAVAARRCSQDTPAPLPATPRPTPTPTVPTTPTAVPTAEPIRLVDRSADWLVITAPTETPTWWPTISAPTRAPATPTPSPAECIDARYGAAQSVAAWGQVLVEIRATNRCRRPLEPSQVSFVVSGFRDGALVRTVRGHPFDTIFPGRSESFSIGLPGSIDFYDQITVEIEE